MTDVYRSIFFGLLDMGQKPNEKKCQVHTPSIHGCVFMGASRFTLARKKWPPFLEDLTNIYSLRVRVREEVEGLYGNLGSGFLLFLLHATPMAS
jgi:hypothetical protein